MKISHRFRFFSLDFVFLLYRFRWILFSFRFISFLFVSQFTSSLMCVCLRIVVSNTYCVVFLFLFVLCFVYPMLPVSLDYPLFLAPAVISDVYLTVLWIFHPSQTGSTLQFEKHASQKKVVSFTTIPPTLSLITACPHHLSTCQPCTFFLDIRTLCFCDKDVFQSTIFLRFTQLKKTIFVWITLRCCELCYSRK